MLGLRHQPAEETPMPTLSTPELTKLSHTLARALSIDQVNQLGRDTGQAERLRTVTPHRLFLAVVATLGGGRVESLADLLRAFNHQNGETVAYKAFYNRLARAGFATFMQRMLARLIDQLRLQTLTPEGHTAVARFTDIVIQDGSSFALKPTLSAAFPGRFTAIEPAAVEVHATYSGFADEVSRVAIAPDAQRELASFGNWVDGDNGGTGRSSKLHCTKANRTKPENRNAITQANLAVTDGSQREKRGIQAHR
jgi:hypothetical protein